MVAWSMETTTQLAYEPLGSSFAAAIIVCILFFWLSMHGLLQPLEDKVPILRRYAMVCIYRTVLPRCNNA